MKKPERKEFSKYDHDEKGYLNKSGNRKVGHNECRDEMQKWFEWLIDEEIESIDTDSKEYPSKKTLLQELKRKVKDE